MLRDIGSNYSFVLMGDSQMQRIDPSIAAVNAFNVASTGEHFYFTWQKLQCMVGTSSRLQGILLGVSIHNFSPFYEKIFDINTPEGRSSLKRYFAFLRDESFLKQKDRLNLALLKEIVFSEATINGFKKSKHSHPHKSIIERALNLHYGDAEQTYCESQVYYLKKIVTFCHENGLELYFISTPYHPYYFDHIHPYYRKVFNEIMQQFQDIPHINFLSDLVSAECMSDGNHLNQEGAKRYSDLVRTRIISLKTSKS